MHCTRGLDAGEALTAQLVLSSQRPSQVQPCKSVALLCGVLMNCFVELVEDVAVNNSVAPLTVPIHQ